MEEKDHTQVIMTEVKVCDFCKLNGKGNTRARYDFQTSTGQWAYGCMVHYTLHRMYEELGTGKGQELIYTE